MSLNSDSIIAVIGAGAMGSGIAQVAAQAGHFVILVDTSDEALNHSRSSMVKGLDKLVARGKITDERKDSIISHIRWTTDTEDVAPARLVIEAIIENLEIKTKLFRKLTDSIATDAILASNTSSLSINAMADQIDGPQRFAGLHFFNPVPVMKLVEVVPGARTDNAVTTALLALMKDWGKVGVRVRDVPGFIVNRVARPYYAEGFAALSEGIAAQTTDHLLTTAGGFRMGPLALADMIGHDVNYVVARSVYEAYDGKTRFRPQPSQQALFDDGNLGRKTGSGVYDYSASLPEPKFISPVTTLAAICFASDHAGIATLADMARNAGMDISIDPALPADSISIGDSVMALGDGRTLVQRENIDVLLDHARDFAASPTWGVTARDENAAGMAAAFAQALGKQLLNIADRPGQLILRTLAQLANAAADAVLDTVASAEDIDAAMRFGANHPEGPLEWARRIGHERIATVLTNIAATTGDDIYNPASLFLAAEAATQ